MAKVIKKFIGYSSFTVPAGVTTVRVIPNYSYNGFGCWSATGTFIKTQSNQVFTMGANGGGALGLADLVSRSSPVAVVGGLSFTRFNISASQSFGLTAEGRLYGIGITLPVGDNISRSSPVLVIGGLNYSHFDLNRQFGGFGITPSCNLYSWGSNTEGQLSLNDQVSRSSPTQVAGGASFKINRVIPAYYNTYAIAPNGDLYACGNQTSGQVGNGTNAGNALSFVKINTGSLASVSFAKVFPYVGSGLSTAVYALSSNKRLYAFGANNRGQLGLNNTVDRSIPVLVSASYSFDTIVNSGGSSSGFALGLTTSGQLLAWGDNSSGQLGVGDTIARSTPTAVLSSLTFKAIYANSKSCLALSTSGDLYGWGQNTFGECGVGDQIPRSSPVLVLGGLTWANIGGNSGGGNVSVFGQTTDGQLYSWGSNASGELGQGNVAPKSSPVLILGTLNSAFMPINNIGQLATPVEIEVTAGDTYNITVGDVYSSFGNTKISTGPVDSITVIYEI